MSWCVGRARETAHAHVLELSAASNRKAVRPKDRVERSGVGLAPYTTRLVHFSRRMCSPQGMGFTSCLWGPRESPAWACLRMQETASR